MEREKSRSLIIVLHSRLFLEEFARVIADTRLGGVLSGKAGIVNVHLGDSPRCLDLIERVVDETEIPATQILPTHINRNEDAFWQVD